MISIIGHKGACGYAPENTLTSFNTAIETGCVRTELDVRLTADKQVVVIHDSTVDRTTNRRGAVKSFSLEELQKLRCEGDQFIPTLQQVVNLCKGKIGLQIELKEENTPEPVNRILLDNSISPHTVISSFHPELLEEMRSLNAAVKILLLFREQPDNLWSIVEKLNLYAIGTRANIITSSLVQEAHGRGLKVYTYRTNVKELGEKLIKMGVDELGTDFPKLFVKGK
jgi:glycerophosphoryl diester phosphodiesterase